LTSAINSINNSAYIIEGTLTEKNDKISKSIDNIESISENLSKVTKELNEFGLSNVLVDLKESTEGINSVIQNLNSESSSLGKLINKDELYENLNSSIISLNNLIDDINENPKKYVHFSIFGRK
jgi:phospholipid/cholesterol/gamma-HCH transport system substrate-binding protein